MMELFSKIVNGKGPLNIFTKMLNHREPFVAIFLSIANWCVWATTKE